MRYASTIFSMFLLSLFAGLTFQNVNAYSQDRYELSQGDKIRITVIGHPDISGDFIVGSDETLSIPYAGILKVSRRTDREIEAMLTTELAEIFRIPISLNLEIIERRPFFIVGDVKTPGSYAYVPGISILKAVALAGGSISGFGNFNSPLEALKQEAQLHSDTLILMRRIAQQARLLTEYEGDDYAPVPPELVTLAGEKEATVLMTGENAILTAQLKVMTEQLAGAEEMVRLKKEELDAYGQQLVQLLAQEQLITTELNKIISLQESGLVSRVRSFELRRDLGQITSQKISIAAVVARAKQELANALRSKVDITLRRRLELKQQIADVQQQVQEMETRVRDGQTMYNVASDNDGLINEDSAIKYEIIRQENTQNVTISVSELSPVKPGDVIKVRRVYAK